MHCQYIQPQHKPSTHPPETPVSPRPPPPLCWQPSQGRVLPHPRPHPLPRPLPGPWTAAGSARWSDPVARDGDRGQAEARAQAQNKQCQGTSREHGGVLGAGCNECVWIESLCGPVSVWECQYVGHACVWAWGRDIVERAAQRLHMSKCVQGRYPAHGKLFSTVWSEP